MKRVTLMIISAVICGMALTNCGSNPKNEQSSKAEKQWIELIKLNGKGEKKSEIFTYSGGKARMRYEFNSDDFGMFAAYVVKEGEDIMREGGFPEVMLDGEESGESNLSHLRKGNYYLNISSANGSWTVVIEEFK